MSFIEHELSLCFPGLVGSEPAGELSWQNLFRECVSPPPATGLQPSQWWAALPDASCFLAQGTFTLGGAWPRNGIMGSSYHFGRIGTRYWSFFFFLFWKECFVFASNRAWIDRIAVWCATLLNIWLCKVEFSKDSHCNKAVLWAKLSFQGNPRCYLFWHAACSGMKYSNFIIAE